MKLIDCGTSGTDGGDVVASWSDLDLGPPWAEIIEVLAPNTTPRAVHIVLACFKVFRNSVWIMKILQCAESMI